MPADAEPPKWLGRLAPLLANGARPDIEGQSPGALLWIPRGGKTFVFTFGYGHSKVKEEWVVPDFGKAVALSVIPQGQVREVRAEQVFARQHIASERAPRASAVREFGFEPDRDLVAAVEGVPERAYLPAFGEKVRGGVSFKFELDVANLAATLDRIIERFDSNDHLRRWPEASNLVLVRDADLIERLDAALVGILVGPRPELSVTLAAPSEKSGDKPYPQQFFIGRRTPTPATSPYLTFATWERHLRAQNTSMSLAAATATRVHMLDEDGEEIGDCSMYQCFGAEASLDGRTYCLSSGNWYAADLQFVGTTNTLIRSLAAPGYPLGAWDAIAHEGAYNEGVCRADPNLWLFDRALVNFGGGRSKLEFCDVMHLPTRTLYFVKHPAGSAGVSHLCEQVRRTVENFFSVDSSFRDRLRNRVEAIGGGWDVTWLATRPQRHQWNLCLVLMGKQAIDLPFFARCGVARLLRELQRDGYIASFQTV